MRATSLSTDRGLHVLAACAVGAATMGLWVNLRRDPPSLRRYEVPPRPTVGAIRPAPTQRELASTRAGDNRARHAVAMRALMNDRPNVQAEVPFDPAAREAATGARAARRAYDGAPPTVPHAVGQMDVPNCLTCHGEGMRLRGHAASVISHQTVASCVQCHVVMEGPMPGAALPGDLSQDNSFVGRAAPGRGERAWPVAPPTIPHSTWMRENCASCHGALSAGLRTSHPWRQSCTQCHAPSAALDQRPGLPQ